jgi:RNA polymerase sigma-70 factor, ECF subfamily
VSASHLTLDYLLPESLTDQVIGRLRTFTEQGLERKPSSRAHAAVGNSSILMQRADEGYARHEEAPLASLVAKGKTGDSAAMEALIERYQSRVAGFVFTCVNEGQAVEDLCQTIFFKMLVGLPRLATVEKFEPWLFRIARNACFDYLRRRRLHRIFLPWHEVDERFATTATNTSAAAGDLRPDRFRQALLRLPKKQRELVALLQDDQLSYAQLAEITHSSVSSVKSRLFRARRQFQRYLQDEAG